MYTLKAKPEDFVVEERIQLELDESGHYAYFWLRKKGCTTQKAVEKIRDLLRCRLRDLGFAGNKDKQALTKQAISVKDPQKRVGAKSLERLNSDEVSFEWIGRGNKPISLGELEGNRFEIIMRECDKEPAEIKQLINYFDEQRFSETNVEVGRAIVKGQLDKACANISYDAVHRHLKEKPNDFVGAMKELPLKTRLMHVHAYQSWLWNSVVSEYLQCKYDVVKVPYSLGELCFPRVPVPEMRVPIVGFGSEKGAPEIENILKELMKKEGITQRDFVIRSMPEISSEGGIREMTAEVKELKIEKKGEKEFLLKFFLTKGCYATMAVKAMMA
ncbi:tRNA pseudouridine(13) synthase TruD [Candidatus Woesearchaeota archaeon]|nr:tRNA pseudouridine(13) synthase TruD [Candidatus Woesearchaeota archaeon]